MSDDYTFGDIDPEDAYDPSENPHPAVVARRLHELRDYLDAVHGDGELPRWDDLDDEDQSLAVNIGGVIVAWLLNTDPDDPERAAQRLHDVRRYWASSLLPPWNELGVHERQVGIDLMAAIIDWLKREGTI